MKRRKIFFICNTLEAGGAERMILNILKHMNKDKYEPFLVLFEQAGIYLNHVPPYVKQLFLVRKGKISYIKIIFLLSFKLFSGLKPDLVISFMLLPNILTLLSSLLALFKPGIIISVRNNPDLDFVIQKNRTIKRILMRILYPLADHVIVISKGIKKALITGFKLKEDRITVVYNGIDIKNVQTLAKINPKDNVFRKKGFYYITACGRLTIQKGFSYLIKAFSELTHKVKALLYIFGEGKERKNLTLLIKNLNMEDTIFLPGFKANPFQYIARSDVFILSSLFEGFGNVIVEAMVCGTPVIATDCPYGPGEIIEHEISGILIPRYNIPRYNIQRDIIPRDTLPGDTITMITNTLLMLLKDKPLRERLSLAGKKRGGRFTVLRMVAGYESVFSYILKKRKFIDS